MINDKGQNVELNVDMAPLRQSMDELSGLAKGFSSQLAKAFSSAITQGKSLNDVVRNLGLSLSNMVLKQATNGLANLFSSMFTNIGSNKGTPTNVTPFAKGGVVSTPTYFGAVPNLGLMGEKGAEAILPLSRGADGRLGVRAQGNGRPTSVVMNISTPDVAGFQKSQTQISTMLAQAVAQGNKRL